MGTPHRGSPDASFGKNLGDVANLALHVSGTHRLTGGINRSLIETLGQESKELLGIAEDFVSRASALRIVTCYEIKTHPLTNKMVRHYRSVLGVPRRHVVGCFSGMETGLISSRDSRLSGSLQQCSA